MKIDEGWCRGSFEMSMRDGKSHREGVLVHDRGIAVSVFLGPAPPGAPPEEVNILWAVSHVASGLRICAFENYQPGDVLEVATRIAHLADWNGEGFAATQQLREDIRAICEERIQ